MSQPHALRAYDYVNRPYAAVRRALIADPGGVFGRATQGAAHRAGELAASLSASIGGLEVGADVTIEVGSIEELPSGPTGHTPTTRVALKWKATRAAALFPSMEAVLSLYSLSKDETQLDLDGAYTPPLGAIGSALDTLLLGRLADASVHRFVSDLAAQLRAEVPVAPLKPAAE
jgi:hypothetical protein